MNSGRLSAIQTIGALWRGFQLCFFEPRVRTFALRPWGIGALVYLVSAIVALFLYDDFVALFIDAPNAWWEYIVAALVWILCGIALVAATLVLTLTTVTLFLGFLQSAVAVAVYELQGIPTNPVTEHQGAKGLVRMTAWEIGKTALLLFLLLISVIFAFFPLFLPLSVALAALVLSLESFDVALDAGGVAPRARIRFAFSNLITILVFGLLLTAIGAIPFAGFLLPPIAVAGAAVLAAPLLRSAP